MSSFTPLGFFVIFSYFFYPNGHELGIWLVASCANDKETGSLRILWYVHRTNAFLFHSFSSSEKNYVKINNTTSTWKNQLRGCLQGSPLGPLPWNLFQNDLSLNVHTSNLFMYADDYHVYQSGSNITAVNPGLTKEAENCIILV